MQSRRQLLQRALAIPIGLRLPDRKAPNRPFECRIVSEPYCLSEESAAGYRLAFQRYRPRFPACGDVFIFAAARNVSQDRLLALRSLATGGAWLIWEEAPFFDSNRESLQRHALLRDTFDLYTGRPRSVRHDAGRATYVRYHWPASAMIRTFVSVTQVECAAEEAIASYEGESIAMKRRVGRGGIIFLGSLLGPHLRAEDREASQLAVALLETAL